MSDRGRSRSPRRRHSQGRSRSRSGSHSASSRHSYHHRDRHYERKHGRQERAGRQKLENRDEGAHRVHMWTDEGDVASLPSGNKKRRDRSPASKRRHRSHRPSRRRSRSSSSSESESERMRSKPNRKHRTSHKDKKRHEKSDKRRKKDSKSTKHAVDQNEYGKHGILRESDFHSKSESFQAWLRDVKKMGEFNGPKWEVMELFKEYMEDYNTCTLPHEKYYDIEKYEMNRYQKQQRKAFVKQKGTSDKTLDTLADEERVRRERLDARAKKEQEEFRLVLQLMDKDKIQAMREQERLRAQMQLFYKSGNVEEARRLEQVLNKVEEDPRFKR